MVVKSTPCDAQMCRSFFSMRCSSLAVLLKASHKDRATARIGWSFCAPTRSLTKQVHTKRWLQYTGLGRPRPVYCKNEIHTDRSRIMLGPLTYLRPV